MGGKSWTQEEIETLKDKYQAIPAKEIAQELDRSTNSIYLKANSLGFSNTHIAFTPEPSEDLSYVLGVVDGDGWVSEPSWSVAFEVKDEEFTEKFKATLERLGLRPKCDTRNRSHDYKGSQWDSHMYRVYAYCKNFVEWYQSLTYEDRLSLFESDSQRWAYIEGLYESDGSHNVVGSVTIASEDSSARNLISNIFKELGVENTNNPNNVYVKSGSKEVFAENVTPVQDRKRVM